MASEKIEKQPNSNLRKGNPAWGKKSDGNGKSGNPNGKPKTGYTLTNILNKKLLEKPDPKYFNAFNGIKIDPDWTWADVIIVAALQQAGKGNGRMLELIWERTEGKLPIPVTGDEERPIHHTFTFQLPDGHKLNIAQLVAQKQT